jgi:hypothetical protein
MQKLTYAEVMTLASFFELMQGSDQDLPTYIWTLFKKNYEELKTFALTYEEKLYAKFMELFPDGVESVAQEEKMDKDKDYQSFRSMLLKETILANLTTISRDQFEIEVPSMKGVRGIYLFMKHIANG